MIEVIVIVVVVAITSIYIYTFSLFCFKRIHIRQRTGLRRRRATI
jgi:hypothetical protein